MLKEYYCLEKPPDQMDTGASRPSKEDIKSLRGFFLLLVKQLVLKVIHCILFTECIWIDVSQYIVLYFIATREEAAMGVYSFKKMQTVSMIFTEFCLLFPFDLQFPLAASQSQGVGLL